MGSIADKLVYLDNTKTAIKNAIESKGQTVGYIPFLQYADKISAIQTGGTGTWSRPSDWLTIDNLAVLNDEKIVGLYAIYPNVNTKGMTNTCAFYVTGSYIVDWGDGTIDNLSSGATAQHIYDYDDFAGTECSRGYRQAIITITPQSGQHFTNFDFGRRHSTVVFGRFISQWLDVIVAGTSLTYFRFQNNQAYPNLLENVKAMQNSSSCINMTSMFNNCFSLQSLDLSSFNTTAVTNMTSMFNNCFSLQSLDLSSFNTTAVTNMTYMFNSCFSLQSLDLSSFNTTAVTNMTYMFNSCYSLQSLDLSSFNTTAVTNMTSMFYSCYSLQSLDLSQTVLSAVTIGNFANFTNSIQSVIKCRLPQVKWSFTVAGNPLSATELNLLFGDLATTTGQTITITGCKGAATCDKTIATSKGWTVIG